MKFNAPISKTGKSGMKSMPKQMPKQMPKDSPIKKNAFTAMPKRLPARPKTKLI